MSICPPLGFPVYNHAGKSIYESLILTEQFSSVSEVRRLIQEGAVSQLPDENTFDPLQIITNFDHKLNSGDIIRIGKRKFIKIE